MSISTRNRYLQILAKNKVTKSHIKKIMIDMDNSGIFVDDNRIDDERIDDETDYLLEQAAALHFGGYYEEKDVPIEIGNYSEYQQNRLRRAENARIFSNKLQAKIAQLKENGLIDNSFSEETSEIIEKQHYGRNLIHEAISSRNLEQVKEATENNIKLLKQIDNNGNTPLEMAYYENFPAAYEYLCDKFSEMSE